MSSLTRALLIFSAALMISLGVVSQGEVFYWHEFGWITRCVCGYR